VTPDPRLSRLPKRVGGRSQARLISFSGIDGAGKSTQITHLQATLEQAGLRVQLITFWDDVVRLKRLREGAGQRIFRGDQGVGTPEAPIERRDKNVRSPWMTAVRLGMYLLDALSLRRIARRAVRSGADVIVFDRYLYDELANLNLANPLLRAYVRALAGMVPRPRPALILDADPVDARRRKPEYPLDFLHDCRNSYLRLSEILGTLTVVAPMPIEAAKREVAALCEVAASADDEKETDGPRARPLAC
jgi:thymidylate kinase